MNKSTGGILATMVVVLLSILTGIFIPFIGGISDLMQSIPGAALNLASTTAALNFAITNQTGSFCICIPIPLAFGVFALMKRANTAALVESRTQHPQ